MPRAKKLKASEEVRDEQVPANKQATPSEQIATSGSASTVWVHRAHYPEGKRLQVPGAEDYTQIKLTRTIHEIWDEAKGADGPDIAKGATSISKETHASMPLFNVHPLHDFLTSQELSTWFTFMPRRVKLSDFWTFHAHRFLEDSKPHVDGPNGKTRADYPADLGTRSSIKEKRVPTGRPAVVQDLQGTFRYVILNAIFEMHGDDRGCVNELWVHRGPGAQIKSADTISLGRVALFANAIPKLRMLQGKEAVHEGYWPIPAQVESSFDKDLKKPVNIVGNGLHLTSTRCPEGEPYIVEDLQETTSQTTKKRERAPDEADPPSEELQGEVPTNSKKPKVSEPTPARKPTPIQSQTSSPAPGASKSTPTPKARKLASVESHTPNPTPRSDVSDERAWLGSLAFTPVNKPTLPDLRASNPVISSPQTASPAPKVGSSSKQAAEPSSSVHKNTQDSTGHDVYTQLISSESESESEDLGGQGGSRLSPDVHETLASSEQKTMIRMYGPQKEAIRETITQMHNTCNLLNEMEAVGEVAMEHVIERENVLEGVIANMDIILTDQIAESKRDYDRHRALWKDEKVDEGERARAKDKCKTVRAFHDRLVERRKEVIQPLVDQYPVTSRRTTVHDEEARAAFAKRQSKTYLTAKEYYTG